LKVLLIPIAIIAFIVFGAIGLGISFIVLATLGKIWQLLTITGRVISRRGRRQQT
jgi:hypothetical protein